MKCLGIDIGGTSVKMAMLEGERTLWTGKSPSYNRPATDQLVDAIRAAAAQPVEGADAVGICVPGLLDKPVPRVRRDVSIERAPVIGPDGGGGSLEGYLGLPAMRKKYGEQVAAAVNKFKGDEPELKALARAIRIAHAIYCPQHIVLAG